MKHFIAVLVVYVLYNFNDISMGKYLALVIKTYGFYNSITIIQILMKNKIARPCKMQIFLPCYTVEVVDILINFSGFSVE